jgi:hypothetical protein
VATVRLKVTRAAADGFADPPPGSARPLFRGNGDTDYLCGNCDAVIAAGMAPGERVIVDTAVCAACGSENEFPPELRV